MQLFVKVRENLTRTGSDCREEHAAGTGGTAVGRERVKGWEEMRT